LRKSSNCGRANPRVNERLNVRINADFFNVLNMPARIRRGLPAWPDMKRSADARYWGDYFCPKEQYVRLVK
jgi:hypothetical protein